ncbi:hypothetical protein T4E_5754 [Trichinella pseudospiralis]|uniref:Uncharacterized protein n=1 Tax=Trichinella pseudospiralis TaxID=6337 RepID=A0A0V0XMK8_TRIPS|nr:hypothetical protein T4E_5754 [Trichinella pseudospiralis]
MLAVIGVGVLRLLRNKRLTPPIMTRFDDVNKKVQKGATLSTALQLMPVTSPNSWILFFAVVCHFSTNSNSSIAETTDFK